MRIVIGLVIIVASLAVSVFLIPESPDAPAVPTETPSDVYSRYRASLLEGRSWDEEAAFYSAAKRSAVAAQLDAQGGDAERVKAMYLEVTAEAARCSEMTLAEETVTATTARLVFDVSDNCGLYGDGVTVREIIDFVLEDGWKISENTTDIAG